MLENENKDGDERYHLPKGEVVITQARAGKGDLRIDRRDGQIRFRPVTISQVLYDCEILDDGHLGAIDKFMSARLALWSALGTDKMRGSATDAEESEPKDEYMRIVKAMHGHDLKTVKEAIDGDGAMLSRRMKKLKAEDGVTYSRALRSLRNTYLDAFDELEKAAFLKK